MGSYLGDRSNGVRQMFESTAAPQATQSESEQKREKVVLRKSHEKY